MKEPTEREAREIIDKLEHRNTNGRACIMILEAAMEARHHSQWYLDQALRTLAGGEYREMIMAWEALTGEQWDGGIAP